MTCQVTSGDLQEPTETYLLTSSALLATNLRGLHRFSVSEPGHGGERVLEAPELAGQLRPLSLVHHQVHRAREELRRRWNTAVRSGQVHRAREELRRHWSTAVRSGQQGRRGAQAALEHRGQVRSAGPDWRAAQAALEHRGQVRSAGPDWSSGGAAT